MKPVFQENKECYFCGRQQNLHEHHIFFGSGNRKVSERLGMKVYLCREHHTGNDGVHFNKARDLSLKRMAENYYLRDHTIEDFIKTFGKSYL